MTRLISFILISVCSVGYSQIDTKTIKDQAKVTAEATINSDFETLLKFTHPTVIKMIGGKDKMLHILKTGKEEMDKEGIKFLKVDIGKPSKTYQAGNEIHCLVPQTIFMKVQGGKLKTEAHLLAISQDNGSNWFFIDTAQLNMTNVRTVLPNFNMALKIPAKTQPTFFKD